MPKSFLRLSTPPMLPAVAVFPAPEKWESWRSCQPPKIRYCACCCCWLCKARISGALRSYIQMCGTRVVVTQSALTHNRCTRTTVCVAELRGRFSSALVLVTLVVGGWGTHSNGGGGLAGRSSNRGWVGVLEGSYNKKTLA